LLATAFNLAGGDGSEALWAATPMANCWDTA
jgi:hypothetical protein